MAGELREVTSRPNQKLDFYQKEERPTHVVPIRFFVHVCKQIW